MSIKRSDFVEEIYKNRPYTPKEVLDYIEGTRQIKFASPQEKEKIIGESTGKFKSLVIKHRIRLYTPLQVETSDAGKDLAKLTLEHCNKTIGLITDEKELGFVVIK